MNQIGITEDHKKVMDGVFEMYDTIGLPLPILFMIMKDKNMIPSPIHFYEDALKAGWNLKTIFNRLEEAYCDTYNEKFWKEVKLRLYYYINQND